MSNIENTLQPGEHIVCKARVHRAAYVYPLLLLGGAFMPGRFTGLLTTELTLTDKRVVGKTGRKQINLLYKDIVTVRIKQGLAGQLFDYGSLILIGNDDSKIVFRGIDGPADLQMQIEEAIETAVLGKSFSKTVMEKF